MSITPRVAKLLHDARSAAQEVRNYCSDRQPEDIYEDRSLQIIVTYLIATVGEALRQAERIDPTLNERIPNLRDIVGTRNRVIHEYNDVNYSILWDMVETFIPELVDTLDRIMEQGEFGETHGG